MSEAFPTYLRYLGSVLGAVLIIAPIVLPLFTDLKPSEIALAVSGGYPLATVMIGLKTVADATNGKAKK